ncbi:OmpA family protein [Tenacibaculum finnmarkense]|uniref:OmpA family protein n=2 Tax=Tenacibaculum finnmarkense TaxID=2781243 RepID=UPI00187B38EF|nr:OmpA family protein [Tenacibaculum finnmarkense]MBE7648293.1 OmpA family protein [Tenacibaculum finnmarkense genomovar ulcerans]
MKKNILMMLVLLISNVTIAQRKYAADRYFKEYSYKKSAELYHKIYKSGDRSALVLERLGDSYYFNSETKSAEKWYKILLKRYEKKVSPEIFFRYAQALKSNGNQKLSDRWMLKFKKQRKEDSRYSKLLENSNYFSEYSNKKTTYLNVSNLSSNTTYSDFGGFILNNDFYFTSSKSTNSNPRIYDRNNQPFLNIYKAKITSSLGGKGLQKDKIIAVKNPRKLAAPISTRYHESNAILTKDGKTMYFTRNNYDGKKLHEDKTSTARLKLYKSILKKGSWSLPKELPFNNNEYSVGHPALSTDEKTLYFVSDMPGTIGASDIYKVAVKANNQYGKPVNLGELINTEGREMFPFVDVNDVLYFSSDGHLGLGLLDVFKSNYIEGAYTSPENLGAPINSKKDDFSFAVNTALSHGFFSSNREVGKGDDDIYSFSIYECNQVISGVLTDKKTGLVLKETVVKLMAADGKVLKITVTKPNGTYEFISLDCETEFIVLAEKNDYKSSDKKIITSLKHKGVQEGSLTLNPLIIENQIVINPIYFDYDLANIREDAAYELENIVSVLNNHPNFFIKIESHTDSRGSKNYNRNLSDRRAKSTRDYIISRGIASNRIESAIGFGEDDLLNHCDDANSKKCTEEEHQKNRRSYFYIVKGNEIVKAVNE